MRSGAVSARELVAGAIARIETLNPHLNAIIHPRFEQALAEAAGPLSGPFAGVPFLVKDLMLSNAGEPYHCGSLYFQRLGLRADEDSTLAARYKAAGLIVLGRTNTPEFGSITTTDTILGVTKTRVRQPSPVAWWPPRMATMAAAPFASRPRTAGWWV